MDKLAGYFDGDNYLSTTPRFQTSCRDSVPRCRRWQSKGMTMKYDRIHKVLGEGNFVLTVSEGTLGGRHTSFYDLFRVQNGKIAEHWDTIEPIPPKERVEEPERQVRVLTPATGCSPACPVFPQPATATAGALSVDRCASSGRAGVSEQTTLRGLTQIPRRSMEARP